METFIQNHLEKWLKWQFDEDERESVRTKIMALVQKYPDVIESNWGGAIY